MKLRFTKKAARSIKKLDIPVRRRIKGKLNWFMKHKNPIVFADYLTDSELGQYRFRIGHYRIVFDVEGDFITVHLIGHRREIYK